MHSVLWDPAGATRQRIVRERVPDGLLLERRFVPGLRFLLFDMHRRGRELVRDL